ncbi:MAG: hypothetical protein ACRCSC_02595, partial [Lactococcus garvieae]
MTQKSENLAMGVKSLWIIVSPSSQQVTCNELAGKIVAVDASIWLYQFVKAGEKYSTSNSNPYILGFFRRICKLLFWGARPIFVFDGVAPNLKQQTIQLRQKFRSSRSIEAARTARKLLTATLKLLALKSKQPDLTIADASAFYLNSLKTVVEPKVAEIVVPAVHNDQRLPLLPEEHKSQDYTTSNEQQVKQNPLLNGKSLWELTPSEQFTFLSELKNHSRRTSHPRLLKMIADSPSAFDFSKSQIKNLLVRNKLTEAVHRVSSGSKSPVPSRIASDRMRKFVLVQNKDSAGWTFEANIFDSEPQIDAPSLLKPAVVKAGQTKDSFPLVLSDNIINNTGNIL